MIDDYQGQGLGSVLLARLVAAARERGVDRFHCEFLAENRNIRALLDEYADEATYHHDHETMTMDFPLPAPRPAERVRDLVRTGPMQRALKHAAGGVLELRKGKDARGGDDVLLKSVGLQAYCLFDGSRDPGLPGRKGPGVSPGAVESCRAVEISGYSLMTSTLIDRGFDSSRLGRTMVISPFENRASTLSVSTVVGSANVRSNIPKRRSTRW